MPGRTSSTGATWPLSRASATWPMPDSAGPSPQEQLRPKATASTAVPPTSRPRASTGSPSTAVKSRPSRSALPGSGTPGSRTCTARTSQRAAAASARALATTSRSASASATAMSIVMLRPPARVLRPCGAGVCAPTASSRSTPSSCSVTGASSTVIPTSTPSFRARMSRASRAPRKRSGMRTRFQALGRCGSRSSASPRRMTPRTPSRPPARGRPWSPCAGRAAALPMLSARSIAAAIWKSLVGLGDVVPGAPPRPRGCPGSASCRGR